MDAKPITLSDSAIDRRRFISALALINNGGNQSKAYAASHPAASPDTCRANAPAFFRDMGIKQEILAQLQKKLDLDNIDVKEKIYELVNDPKTQAATKLKCWELIAKLKGELTERRELVQKNVQPQVDPEKLKEFQETAGQWLYLKDIKKLKEQLAAKDKQIESLRNLIEPIKA